MLRTRYLAAAAAGLLTTSLVAALVRTDTQAPPPRPVTDPPKPVTPLFAKVEPAANAPVLVLLPDERGVRGWVAGKHAAPAGTAVTLRLGNARTATAKLAADGTFAHDFPATAATPVTATVTLPGVKQPLTARTTVLPAPAVRGQTAFFVTDRSAYRPGHTLRFVAFLRKLDPDGEFEPPEFPAGADREVLIDITSQAKQTRAARIRVRADAHGRITGEYTFSDADALDHYVLTASGFAGSARVLLGEYRKTKVGLKLTGEVKDGKLHVSFDARDYLDRPVKGTAATYTAAVARAAEPAKLTLNPDEFAHPEGGPPGSDELEALPDDERLLTLANGVSAMTFAGFGSRQVASRDGNVDIADGAAKLVLDLHPEWLKGGHTVTVAGVFTDDTGRENRAAGTFPLELRPVCGVSVTTPKETYALGEKIPAAVHLFGLKRGVQAATTLIVVRLDAQPANPWVTPDSDPEGTVLPDNTRLPAIGAPAPKPKPAPAAGGWKAVPVFDPVKRRVVSATPVAGGATTVELKQPGAYKLLAVTRLPDGSSFQSETGVVVKAPAKLPGVVLHLDRREITSGTRLTGAAHTRFAGAKLLLTLRDAQGVKVVKPLTADARGVAVIDEPLPANLRYGCAVCVQYPESATQVHADQRDLFVIPNDRTIGVTVTPPAEVGPGAEVKLGVKLDRKEEVDLIVSVFDESLLGVSGDLAKDIRNHFLADARGQARAARDLAATRVGAVTVAELVKKAEALLADKPTLDRDPVLRPQLEGLVNHWKEGRVGLADVVTLVRLTGLEVYLAHSLYHGDGTAAWNVPKTATLADLLRWEKKDAVNGQRLFVSATVVGNVALVGVAARPGRPDDGYPSDPWVGHRGNPYGHAPPRCLSFNGGYFGGMSCTGFQQIGFGQCGFSCTGFSGWQFHGPGFNGISGFGGNFGFGAGGLQVGGGQLGQFGNLAGQFGFGKGGGFGGGFGGGGFAGGNAAFSQPFVGGQMGMSFGFNRDFGPVALPAGGVALPGLGLPDEVVRRDFADSAHWTAKLRTAADGTATASFKLPDSLTNWRVQVTAVSPKMHVGTGTATFKSTRAVMVWPMLPRTFTEGDTVRVFGTVHNLTDKEQTIRAHLKAENGRVLADAEQAVTVPAKGSAPVYWDYRAGTKGFTDLLMSAKCDAGSDASLKKLPVTPAGVLERATASGLVGKGDLKLTLPADFDPARATATVTVAPTLAADLADTLPYLVEYPYGCVEQTMSRFLPAIRVAQILKQSGGGVPKELEAKLPKVVEQGQKRLIELQQPDGGWAWQGSGTTHEMMTPYALFGLIAAEQAGYPCPNPHTIDRGMGRLKQYLDDMGRQWDAAAAADPKGRHPVVNDALFCLWVAATRDDTVNLDPWWVRIVRWTETPLMSDAGCAFALEVAVKRGKKPFAGMLAAELRKRAKTSGDRVYWTSAGFSRWGDNTTEVTATVMKALVAHDPHDPLLPGVLAFFHATKRGDRWDSTKDTASVLYALCDYLAAVKAGPAAAGEVKVSVNGVADGTTTLDGPTSKVITLTGKDLKPGENVFAVTGPDAKAGGLARVVVAFTRGPGADIPARDHGVKVERTVSVRAADGTWAELKTGAAVPAGSYVRVRVTATPGPGTQLQYTLLESPKPAGGETVPADDGRFAKDAPPRQHVLREDREAMTCFHYERAAGPVTAEFVVLTEFAGEFRLAPARVELMYKPTVGGHSDSFVLKVGAKK
ncbi:MAG: hypothetical protein C0501_20385 [Isosphaera sp.]|nr:hypothetical protein [Isosphaera sp.]